MWAAIKTGFGAYGSNGGTVVLITPEGNVEPLEMPEGMAVIDSEGTTFASFVLGDISRLHIAGGLTDNSMITEQRQHLRHFIRPMSQELVVSAAPAEGQIGIEMVAAANGLVGNLIFALRWHDTTHPDRRSPFSGLSPTIVGNGLLVPKLRQVPLHPDPDDACVDEVELWCNRNGESLGGRPVFRRIGARDSGIDTMTFTEYVEGAAETADNLQEMPRCRFFITYHGRLWGWGNRQDPSGLFGSILNRTAEYGGLRLQLKDGKEIIAGVEVRGTLAVFSSQSSGVVRGWSDADFFIDNLNPDLGCVCHAGIAKIGEDALIPTHNGFYIFDGQAMRAISGDYREFWTQRYKQFQSAIENGFGVNDKDSKVYKFYEANTGRVWVLDYRTMTPDLGGTYAPPLLSFDSHSVQATTAANLSNPGSRIFACFSGHTDGRILRNNVYGIGQDDAGYPINVVIFPAPQGAVSASHSDGLQLNELWLFLSNWGLDPSSCEVRIINGNEFATLVDANSGRGGSTVAHVIGLSQVDPAHGRTFSVANGNEVDLGKDGAGVENMGSLVVFGNLQISGEFFAPRIAAESPKKLIYHGWGMTVQPGRNTLVPASGD